MKISLFLSALACVCFAATETTAATPEVRDRGETDTQDSDGHRDRKVAFADTVVRAGPLGAMLTTGVYVRRTFEVDELRGFERSYLQAGLSLGVNPAYVEPQAHLEYLPAPFLALRAEAAMTRYFGANYGLLRFDSSDADFGDSALSERRGDEHSAWGQKGRLSILPRARFGRWILRSTLSVTGYHFDDPGPYVYEPELDTLLATTDLVITARSEALFELHRGPGSEALLLGSALESMRTLDTELSRTRLGALASYVVAERWGGLRRPRVYAFGGVNLTDANRSGEPVALLGVGADME